MKTAELIELPQNYPSPVTTTETLPALLARAGTRLIEARSSAEVMEAKKVAELALDIAKITRAAHATHADCIRIISLAEMRMADEIDRGQEAGEVARPGGDTSIVRASDNGPATLSQLGVPRQRLAEWREVRDAGPEVIEDALAAALAEDRAPTKSDVLRFVREAAPHNHRAQYTGDFEWYTPAAYIDAARDVMGSIDLDPASCEFANQTVKAEKFFSIEDNGLSKDWFGSVWLNPPYSQPAIMNFMEKLVAEVKSGNVKSIIALTHNSSDSAWFQLAAENASAMCFTRGRIRFISQTKEAASPTQGQTFFYVGADVTRFAKVFSNLGIVVTPQQA